MKRTLVLLALSTTLISCTTSTTQQENLHKYYQSRLRNFYQENQTLESKNKKLKERIQTIYEKYFQSPDITIPKKEWIDPSQKKGIKI
jgi:peptidoglycan hydrolase CwlO-like protein